MFVSRCSECGSLSRPSHSLEPEVFNAADTPPSPGTRHYRLLNSNEAPDDSELPFIRSVISKTDAQLERLKPVVEAYTSLSNYRAINSTILSPLRRMPAELLREIFAWTLPSLRDDWSRGRFEIQASPWVLTHVSSRWRAVSLSTPSLWSRVAIEYFGSSDPSSGYPLSVVEAQIQRAQKLKIHFYACEKVDTSPQLQMFQFLSQHSERWEELSIGITAELVPLLAALRDRVPSLRRLWINWNCRESQRGVQSIDSFQTASSLVDFGTFHEYRFIPIAFPIHQLTRYQLDGPWDTHKDILTRALNLVEARITIDFDDQSQAWLDSDDIFDLTRLQRLYVSDSGLLDRFRAPALEELALAVQDDDNPDILQLLEAFIGRSACPLRRLCLKECPNAHTTITILEKIPRITELSIIIHDFDACPQINALMEALTVKTMPGSGGMASAVAPELQSLRFGCTDESYIDAKLCLKMLRSRWEVEDRALKTAALLTNLRPGSDSVVRGLRALRQEGLDILLLEGLQATDQIDSWSYARSTSWD
ncbi:hypothetical protein B0H19DRAFT_486595 [Mycena capillaripes]|nr:hypothetical protein B0H19DRAFT_486595 [Mycena capillaripes]